MVEKKRFQQFTQLQQDFHNKEGQNSEVRQQLNSP